VNISSILFVYTTLPLFLEDTMVQYIDSHVRVVIVYLKSPLGGKTTPEIASEFEIALRTVNRIYAKAIERGFDPNTTPFSIKPEYVQDAPRSGRPSKQTEANAQVILENIQATRYGRELSSNALAGLLNKVGIDISRITV
jgi:transposase